MDTTTLRRWATPLTIGAFILMAVTGILMFFHVQLGIIKVAHEWLSWAMVAGVSLHIFLNLNAFKRYFTQTTGKVVVGLFALVLALSFIPAGGDGSEPGFAPPIRALSKAPLPVLAQVLGTTPEALKSQLATQGHPVQNEQQSLEDLVGTEVRAQIQTITALTPKPAQP